MSIVFPTAAALTLICTVLLPAEAPARRDEPQQRKPSPPVAQQPVLPAAGVPAATPDRECFDRTGTPAGLHGEYYVTGSNPEAAGIRARPRLNSVRVEPIPLPGTLVPTSDIATTAIYTTAVGVEARGFLARMWAATG